jgi:hypothetical protein
MTVYHSMGTAIGTADALELAQRLAAWHDAMVVHQRRSESADANACDEDCPHTEARLLWLEALGTYGDRAHALRFLRQHAGTSLGRSRTMPADSRSHVNL